MVFQIADWSLQSHIKIVMQLLQHTYYGLSLNYDYTPEMYLGSLLVIKYSFNKSNM